MKIYDLKNFTRGWFVGNFEPTILKTKEFEIGIASHKKDENWPKHYHKVATEFNVILNGKIKLNDTVLDKNKIFVVEKEEVTKIQFLEDSVILVIKTPSVPGDKYIVKEEKES